MSAWEILRRSWRWRGFKPSIQKADAFIRPMDDWHNHQKERYTSKLSKYISRKKQPNWIWKYKSLFTTVRTVLTKATKHIFIYGVTQHFLRHIAWYNLIKTVMNLTHATCDCDKANCNKVKKERGSDFSGETRHCSTERKRPMFIVSPTLPIEWTFPLCFWHA